MLLLVRSFVTVTILLTALGELERGLVGGWGSPVGLAAAGLAALEEMTERLAEDHVRAGRLALGLQGMRYINVLNPDPNTNLSYIELAEEGSPEEDMILELAGGMGIPLARRRHRRMRLVNHYWITDEAVNTVLTFFRDLARDLAG